jgi:hypothetical protein
MTDRLDDDLDQPADGENPVPDAPNDDAYVRARWHGVDEESGERVDLTDLRGGAARVAVADDELDVDARTDGRLDERGESDADDHGGGLAATGADAWYARAYRRAVRRPTEWVNRPWPAQRIVQFGLTVLTLAATTAIMMNVVHFNPLSPSTRPGLRRHHAHGRRLRCPRLGPRLPPRPPAAQPAGSTAGAWTGTRASPCTASTWCCRRSRS